MIMFFLYCIFYCFGRRKPSGDIGCSAFILGFIEVVSSLDSTLLTKILGV